VLQLIRNNSPFTVLVLLIISLLLKLQVLIQPAAPVLLPDHFIFNNLVELINKMLHGDAMGYTVLGIILTFFQALYLNAITIRHRLFYKPTYIPAFMYILLTSVMPEFSFFTESLVVNWFILGAIDVMFRFMQPIHPQQHIFNAGFLIAMAALFQFPAVFYFLLLLMALILLRSFTPGEWLVGLLGFLTPFYFLIGILFLADKLQLIEHWPHFAISIPALTKKPALLAGGLAGLLLLTVCGLFVMQSQMPKSTIYVRRSWGVVTTWWIVSVIVAICTAFQSKAAWVVSAPALSLIIAHPLYLEKSKRFSTFIFYFSLLFVIFCQVAFNK
jgi:Family of unknown function (DUF6427)